MNSMRMTSIALVVALIAACTAAPAQISTEKVPAMAVIRLKGAPQGGGVRLWVKGRIMEVPTRPGEDLAQIARDAAAQINADQELKSQGVTARSEAQEIKVHTNEAWVYLCASDGGLNVPRPPTDLRAEKHDDGVTYLSWKIPQGGYDRIYILRGTVPIADGIAGTNTTFGDVVAGEKMTYTVFGIKDGTPSCAATF
ncbi:MAG TPA: hypothetical protein VKE93_18660 [Candidatus Angelobacter sp.]|nr:hypothetical protein [Candidatus Angelobacter sp.]